MSWIQLTSVTATNNSNVIVVNTGSTVGIKTGDALLLAGFDLVEVEGVFATQLQLRKPWPYATQSSVQAVVVPTFGDFNNAVEEVRNLRKAASDTLNELYANFVEKEEGKGLSTNDLTDELLEDINNKVDKEEGKGLSTHDYDDDAKEKVDEMGTAASRDVTENSTDTTAGRLLKVRDFGLGSTSDISALSGIPSQFGYTVDVSSAAAVLGMAGPYIANSTLGRAFILAARGGRAAIRTFGQDGDPTLELYHNRNAVGPVSQSGGVPTGGLMQYGETPNGRFFRYANGFQLCLPPVSYYIITEEGPFTWSFPAPFFTQPQVVTEIGSADASSGFEWLRLKLGGNNPTTSNTQAVIFYSLAAGSNTFNSRLGLFAIGRWY